MAELELLTIKIQQMNIESTNDNNSTNTAITYSECYAQVFLGDCLEQHENIKSGSVDLILTDLPYGNMNTDGGRKMGINGWDLAIEPSKVYEIANRILRKNGKMILFSQEPYTSRMITEAIPNIPFNYRATWEKDNFANALGVNVNMVSFTEDILVFSKMHDLERSHPLIDYFMTELEKTGMNQSDINRLLGNKMGGHYFTNGVQFCIPTEVNYIISTLYCLHHLSSLS